MTQINPSNYLINSQNVTLKHVLDENTLLQINNNLKKIFSDFERYDLLVADRVKAAIFDSNNIEINQLNTKNLFQLLKV